MIGRMFHVTISYARSYLLDAFECIHKKYPRNFPSFSKYFPISSRLYPPQKTTIISPLKKGRRGQTHSLPIFISRERRTSKLLHNLTPSHSNCNHSYVTIIMNPIQREEKEREMGKAYFNELLLLKAEKFPSSSRIRLWRNFEPSENAPEALSAVPNRRSCYPPSLTSFPLSCDQRAVEFAARIFAFSRPEKFRRFTVFEALRREDTTFILIFERSFERATIITNLQVFGKSILESRSFYKG